MKYEYESNRIVDGKTIIVFTNAENEIFNVLYSKKRGKLCSYQEIYASICDNYKGSADTIKTNIYNIRKKLNNRVNIRVVYNKGYIID